MIKQIPIPPRSEVAPVALEFHKEKLIQARKIDDEDAISFHLGAIHRLECEIKNIRNNYELLKD